MRPQHVPSGQHRLAASEGTQVGPQSQQLGPARPADQCQGRPWDPASMPSKEIALRSPRSPRGPPGIPAWPGTTISLEDTEKGSCPTGSEASAKTQTQYTPLLAAHGDWPADLHTDRVEGLRVLHRVMPCQRPNGSMTLFPRNETRSGQPALSPLIIDNPW